MHAALITDFARPPRYTEVAEPHPESDSEIALDVLASALHPRVRSQADGSHYTATGILPLIPGVDGVGRDVDGMLRYFVTDAGAMADRAVIAARYSVPLPAAADPVALAAGMNPAMSSWVALRQRAEIDAGQHVVILGATGNAGRMAIEVARHLGAGRVSAVGRDTARFADLSDLGADDVLTFDEVSRVADADIVLDYVWGAASARAMVDVATARIQKSEPYSWVQIGSMAGPEAAIPSAVLRSTAMRLVGSGQGSVHPRDLVAEAEPLAAFVAAGGVTVNARAVPLSQVAEAWMLPDTSSERIVFTP